jgi:hypothetical protein
MTDTEKSKAKLVVRFCKFTEKKGHPPSSADITKWGYNCDKVRRLFGGYDGLKAAAKEASPKSFSEVVDDSLFTPKAFAALRDEASNFSRFFVTTAVEGCEVHQGFFSAISTHNRKREAMTLVLPSTDPAANVPFHLDSALSDTAIVGNDLALNKNLFLSSIRLSAKHIDPATGLSRIGQRNGSFIYASPKQRLKMTPTSNVKIPHAIMTTGALTKPDYDTDRYLSKRTAYISDHDHVMGGIIVELVDNQHYHYRQVQADSKGAFIDLAVMYCPDGTTKTARPEALVLGDWHSGETDPTARIALIDAPDSVANVTKPKRLVIHDGFNGRSISHHEIKNKALRAKRALSNELDLNAELEAYAKDLEAFCALPYVEEVVIVKSNHDEFLDRYLAEARYVEDAQNHLLALELAQAMITGTNPLEHYMAVRKIKNGGKLRWLSRDEDFKVAGIELGAHGDKGANGAKGSLMAMENAYSNSVSGHSHTPEILRGAWQVGTTSYLKLSYTSGPSSWLHTACLVYANGGRQLINIIEGSWRG